jgi:hypothetical protein
MMMEKSVSSETSVRYVHRLSLPTNCTIFIIYFLPIEVLAIDHGHLKGVASFLDVSSICCK